MTVELDRIIRTGTTTVAAVVRRSVGCGFPTELSFYGAKSPLAILVRRDGVTSAFAIDGSPIAPDDFERRFPGQRAAFERLAGAEERDGRQRRPS